MAQDVRIEQQPMGMASLIAAPVRAVMQAQAQAELETLRYIVEVGLDGDDRRRVATLDFQMIQPVPDIQHPGEFVPTPTTVTVPILSLVRVPTVTIREADIDLAVNVTRAVERDEKLPIPGREIRAVDLQGVFGSRADLQRRSSLTIRLKVEAGEEQESLERLRRLLGDTMTAVPQERRS